MEGSPSRSAHVAVTARVGWVADLWLIVTEIEQCAVWGQLHFRITSRQAIL